MTDVIHELGVVSWLPDGYAARCSCGREFTGERRELVEHRFAGHVHVEDARAALREGQQ